MSANIKAESAFARIAQVGRVINFAREGFAILGSFAPLLLLLSVIAIGVTGKTIASIVKGAATMAKVPEQSYRIEKTPLAPSVFKEVLSVMTRLNPAVKFELVGNLVRISVDKPEKLPEWSLALSALDSSAKGVAWEAQQICAKKCDQGVAALAVVKGYRQQVVKAGKVQ